MNLAEKLLACFVNNLGMAEGLQLIANFEAKGEGVNFSNWTRGFSVDDNFTMFEVMIILFFNNFIHLFWTFYLENVMPGIHGIAKPWHFLVTDWFDKSKKDDEKNNLTNTQGLNRNYCSINDELITHAESNEETHSQIFIEDESIYSARRIGIKIKNIVKIFKQLGKIKTAVKNLSLDIYEGQISVLLGLNYIFFVFYLLKFN